MRTFIFLCCSLVFSLNPDKGFSQNTKILIESTKTISVEDVFDLIKSQTDYHFVFRPEHILNAPEITVNKGKVKVSKLLNQTLKPVKCTFEFTDNTVIIKKENEIIPDYYIQDEFTITGNVTDELGNAIAGANVFTSSVENDNPNFILRGTQTDFDGSFELKVSINQHLITSFLGFENFKQKITTKQKEYTVVLKEASNKLDEVVLTGYTTTTNETSTVASSKVTKKDINRQKTINLSDRLEGVSPGLNINSVSPSGGQQRTELILRGISTFDRTDSNSGLVDAQNSLNRQPLIVLDGFPYEGPLNDIDPQTIETIDILRDAAATTLWGIRASNGVIVITTKRGSKYDREPSITFSSNVTIGTKIDLDGLGLANAEETIKVFSNNYEIFGDNFANRVFSSSRFNRYRRLDAFNQIWADFYNANGGISATERDSRLQQLSQNNVLKDYEKHLLSPGFIRENSLSIRGGTPVASYSFTTTHVKEERPNLGDEFQRLNLSLTTDFELTKKLSAVVDASLTTSETNDNGIGVASLTSRNIQTFDRLVDNNGNPRAIRNIYDKFQNEFLALGFEDGSYNPILDQSLRDNEAKSFNLRLAAGINYKITDWLTADVKYQYNQITDKINNNKDVRLFETRTNNNNYITNVIGNGNNFVERSVPYGGTLQNSVINSTNTILRGSLQFNKTFSNHHNLTALVGMEVSKNIVNLSRRTYYGYNDETGISDIGFDVSQLNPIITFLGTSIPSYIEGFVGINLNNQFRPDIESRAISSFGNVGYSYKSKYNINLSGKIDQTTAFGINERLSKPILWAASGSWNLAKENFFSVDWVNTLKLRGSYGVNGNLRRGLSTVVIIDYSEINNRVNDRPFADIESSGNPDLTFEETTTKNIGVDFGFLDNRIRGSLDFYDKLSENLLVPFNINDTFGQTGTIFRNDGSISNKGVEFNLNLDVIREGDFGWNANFNIAYNKNKVLSFSTNNFTSSRLLITDIDRGAEQIIGQDVSTRYRFEWAGLDAEGHPQVFNENGDIVGYQDAPPSIDALVTTKPFIAPGFGGFRNTFNYKDLSLSFLASFKFGHVFQESLSSKYGLGVQIYHKDVANAWELPGDELTTNIPALPRNQDEFTPNRVFIFTGSNYNIQNASFIRLRDVTLGYTLNNDAIKKIGFEGVHFTLQARNLGILWRANDVDIDPDSIPFITSSNSSTDNFSQAFRPGIVAPVTYVLGVNLNF